MLPRHLQRLSRDLVVYAERPKALRMNRHFFRSPWWTGHHPRTPYTPGSVWRPPGNWRPHRSFVPSRAQYQNPCVPWSPHPSAWLHASNVSMASKADEQLPKHVKSAEQSRQGRKMASKRSYSPTTDFRVLPTRDPEEHAAVNGRIRREWEDFSQYYIERARNDKDSRRCKKNFEFSVLSYNILSQDLLEDNSHLYSHCRRPLLFWSYRLPNILKEIEELDADILCLQEVQEDHYRTQIKPCLEDLGYHCEYKTRTGSKPDGCAICFKPSKFILKLVKPVEYYRRDIALLDRDNIGLVLLLQPRSKREAPTICVANTHLLYNPKRGDIKLTQLAILLAEIYRVAHLKDMSYCPIVLCGDFNSVPGSPLHRFIKDGMLNYAGLSIGKVSGQEKYTTGRRILPIPIWPKSLGITQNCVYEGKEITEQPGEAIAEAAEEKLDERLQSSLQHRFSLSSVYSHYVPETGVPEVTTCHSKSAITVDYIFYSSAKDDIFAVPGSDVSCKGLKLLGRRSLLTEKDLWSVNGLPNKDNSSDHLSLLAKFRLET